MIEAQDKFRKWYLAEITDVKGEGPDLQVRIHYDGYNPRWDEWLLPSRPADAARMRAMGAADPKTDAQKLKESQDIAFRADMKAKGMDVVTIDGDGHCLFRCFAHQIYGDANKHAEVRKACCDYMVRGLRIEDGLAD
jgi:hypothetical protein